MPECVINGVPVNFPFEPYDVQKAYMAKVIDCLQNRTNGMLESPTGTGKTLSLLCSTLAWIMTKKAQLQAQQTKQVDIMKELQKKYGYDPMKMGESQSSSSNVMDELDAACGISGKNWNVPKVIYASRTHSQLTQAMQELKRSSYNFMKAIILGSRDQLCIHPDVSKETNNSAKVQLCKLHMLTRTCSYFLKVEANKNSPHFLAQSIMDIEDLVSVGRKLKTCPYYASRELVQDADIIFMPYNYLLDPKARKANKIELNNTIIILDEAHNVEKMCEESASVQVKSSDIALCIDDLTQAMKAFSDSALLDGDDDAPKDFTVEDLALFKEMLLDLEKAVDEIEVTPITGGTTFPGGFIFELLAKANITHGNQAMLNRLLESLIQYITAANQSNPVFRRGGGLQVLSDLLTIAFAGKDENADEKIKRCFKVHVDVEEVKEKKTSTKKDGWITPKGGTITKTRAKVINYWCFNPGYGMGQLLCSNVHSIILTSGTLAPLKPLIAELGIPISVRLENPHIVSKSQVYVKIVPFGPDKEPLISNYHNRDNVKYLSSLGRTILSFCPIIPDGLLIFFPSYPLMNKCIDSWQASGIWSQISRHKPIFVEPRGKDAFTSTMTEFYEKINDPTTKGACFMAVCRGKVSEGLDFADKNGRAVIITGLPFPPFKDPRVMLKKKYLEENRTRENELLSGDSWYALEGIRAVNQAIGRVIRHKDDYGAILLCDSRFSMSSQRSQLSAWIQTHLQNTQPPSNFGQFISEMSRFFRNAQSTLPQPCKREVTSFSESTDDNKRFQLELADIGAVRKRLNIPSRPTPNIKIENANEVSAWHPNEYKEVYDNVLKNQTLNGKDFSSRLEASVSSIDFNKYEMNKGPTLSTSLVTIHKREKISPIGKCESGSQMVKRRKLKLVSNDQGSESQSLSSSDPSCSESSSTSTGQSKETNDQSLPADRTELLKLIKSSVPAALYSEFVRALMTYQKDDNIAKLTEVLKRVFQHPCLEYLLRGMKRFVKANHKDKFDEYLGQSSHNV